MDLFSDCFLRNNLVSYKQVNLICMLNERASLGASACTYLGTSLRCSYHYIFASAVKSENTPSISALYQLKNVYESWLESMLLFW